VEHRNFSPSELAALEKKLGYSFGNKKLLIRALTHSSASGTENYEQLEFLGDSVIQLVVTDKLYAEGGTEGEMTAKRQKLVSHAPLKIASEKLKLPSYIVKGVPDVGEKPLSSVYESVCGAIFTDGGYAAAEKFIKRTLLAAHVSAPRNYKGDLQEYVQGLGERQPLPVYNTRPSGDDADKQGFVCDVLVCGKSFSGTGKSKSEAERNAAKSALSKFK